MTNEKLVTDVRQEVHQIWGCGRVRALRAYFSSYLYITYRIRYGNMLKFEVLRVLECYKGRLASLSQMPVVQTLWMSPLWLFCELCCRIKRFGRMLFLYIFAVIWDLFWMPLYWMKIRMRSFLVICFIYMLGIVVGNREKNWILLPAMRIIFIVVK